MRLHRVNEVIHRGWNTSFSRLQSWRLIHIDHGLEQENYWGVISSTEWTGEVPRMLGEKM